MINLIANLMILAGAAMLVLALSPIHRLLGILPRGSVHLHWRLLQGLVGAFLFGYLGYLLMFWGRAEGWFDLIVPAVFFFGAAFVWQIASLSLQTATDLRRVAILEHENITDPLIGIYNRRYMDRRLHDEFERAQRYDQPLSVLMIDVDHFKKINDTYSHKAGDLVLKHLGNLLLEAIRSQDIAARYGGEEIALIAPGTTAPKAAILAERIRARVEEHAIVFQREGVAPTRLNITVSIGVATLGPEIHDGEHLLSEADAALYRAKQDGRNRVRTYFPGNALMAAEQLAT